MSGTDALMARIEACIPVETDEGVFEWDSDNFADARAALAELVERAEKLEAVVEEARWVVEHVYPHGSSLKDALAAVSPSGSAALSSPETDG